MPAMRRSHEDELALEEVEHGATIRVTAGEGINLQLNARVPTLPEHIYKVLIDPNAATVFRSIQACSRQVLEEDARKGTRKLAVTHKSICKFLLLKITFETHLIVWEDDHEKTIRFMNAREGFMKKFEGNWHVRPFNQHSLDLAMCKGQDSAGHHAHMPTWMHPAALLTGAQRLLHVSHPDDSLVTLEQHIVASQQPPPPVKSIIRRLVSKQLRDMMEDLRNELDRRAKIKATGQQSHQLLPVNRATGPSHKAGQAVTASITSSPFPDIWQYVEPLVSITIQL